MMMHSSPVCVSIANTFTMFGWSSIISDRASSTTSCLPSSSLPLDFITFNATRRPSTRSSASKMMLPDPSPIRRRTVIDPCFAGTVKRAWHAGQGMLRSGATLEVST